MTIGTPLAKAKSGEEVQIRQRLLSRTRNILYGDQMKVCEPQSAAMEQILSTIINSGSNQNVYVNLTLSTGDEELVLSMERFAGELKSVDCSSNMMMTFLSNSTFQSAIASWSWVNFNEKRTFIMIANYAGCSPDNARQPWVISNVDYDLANLVVYLNATQKSWPEIAHTFSLDFGKYQPSPPVGHKRSIIDVTQSFSIDLNQPLPQTLLPDTAMSDYLPDSVLSDFDFEIDCVGCGSKGSLELQGHVESDIWNGISDFTLTVIPHGIEAVLDLKVIATGTVPTDSWGHQWHLFDVGIPALSIPDVLELGPNLDFSAGFNITKLSGSVSLEAGVTGAIPNTARAEVDLVQKTSLDIHGWTPVFTPIPFNLDLEVDLDFELYVAVAVQVSLEAMSESTPSIDRKFESLMNIHATGTGFNTDLQLKIPDITVNATGSYSMYLEPREEYHFHLMLTDRYNR